MVGKHRAKGFTALLPLVLSFTLTLGNGHSPLLPTVPQDSQGKAARLNTELGLPKAGFSIRLSLSCPHTGLPVDTKLLNKAVTCQGCPKSGQPAQESAAFSTLPWEVQEMHVGNPRRNGIPSQTPCL